MSEEGPGVSPEGLNRLTNNWAGVTPARKGLLPPIKHKLHSAVEKFPVIPPIATVRAEHEQPVRTIESDTANRNQRNTRTRNIHLRKVYLVSLCQLLVVLLAVVVFTEVPAVREYNNHHSWIGVLLIVLILIFLCSWILIVVCFPSTKQQRFYNVSLLIIFTLCEGLLLGVLSTDRRGVTNPSPSYGQYFDRDGEINSLNFSSNSFNESERNIDHHQNQYQKRLNAWHVRFELSTATISVAFCVIVCTFFIILSFQTRFDGDFMGGLVHSFLVIVISVMVCMSVSPPILWSKLWYGGLSSFFLWFFHRMVVFPLIAVIFPYKRYMTQIVSNN